MVTVLLLSAIIPPLVVFSFGGGRDVLTSRDDFPDSVGTRPDVVSRDDADRLQTIGESGDLGWKQYSTMCRSRVGSWCYRCCQLAASATQTSFGVRCVLARLLEFTALSSIGAMLVRVDPLSPRRVHERERVPQR